MKTVFVIYGSPTKSLLDDAVINAAIKKLHTTINFERYDNIHALPHFGSEDEGKETVALFKKRIAASDCILIVCMDHPYNLAETVGNAFKWAATAVDVSTMPVGLITADSGRYEIQHSLVTMLNNNGVNAREDNSLILERNNMVSSTHNEIVNLRILEEIRELVTNTVNLDARAKQTQTN